MEDIMKILLSILLLLLTPPSLMAEQFLNTRNDYPWERLFTVCFLTSSFVEMKLPEKANYCYKLEQNSLDRGLNRSYRLFLGEIDLVSRKYFKSVQRAWITYRDRYFQFLNSLCLEKQSINDHCDGDNSEINRLKAKFIEQQVLRLSDFIQQGGLADSINMLDYLTDNELREWNFEPQELRVFLKKYPALVSERIHPLVHDDSAFLSEEHKRRASLHVRHAYFYEQEQAMNAEVSHLNGLIEEELYSDQLELFNNTKKAYYHFQQTFKEYMERIVCDSQFCDATLAIKLNKVILDRIDVLEMLILSQFYIGPQELYYQDRERRFNNIHLGDWDYE